jgi:hypothetical protein
MKLQEVFVPDLCLDIMYNGLHLPLVDGKANRDRIEDEITIAMLSNELGYVNQYTVDLAIEMIDEAIEKEGEPKW